MAVTITLPLLRTICNFIRNKRLNTDIKYPQGADIIRQIKVNLIPNISLEQVREHESSITQFDGR